jgi:hypothetical protein
VSFVLDLDGYIPSLWQIDDTMTVLSADEGAYDPAPWL